MFQIGGVRKSKKLTRFENHLFGADSPYVDPADPAAASTFLNAAIVDAGVTSFTISVESIEIAPTSEAEQGPASQLSAGAIAGIIVGGIVGVVVLALIVFKMTRKGRSGSDKPNFKKSANANAQVSV